MKKIVLIVLFIVSLNKLYTKQTLKEEYITYFESYMDNTTPAYDKITKTYEYSFLLGNIDYLMENAPPECVRYNNGIYYFIYKIEDGYFLQVPNYGSIWDKWTQNKWTFIEKVYICDFDEIKRNETTMNDIQVIDEYATYVVASGSRQPSSIHFTADGYKIVIKYIKKEIGEEITMNLGGQEFATYETVLVVDSIKKYKGRKNPIYFNLLPIDKALLE